MAGEVVATAIAEEAVRSCFEMIGHYISYTRNYKNNIKSLKDELKKIQDIKDTVQRDVQIAQNNAEDIRQDVVGWLDLFEELKRKVDELLQPPRPFNMSCLCCSCPNIKSRYLASSQAAELTSLITRHLEEGKFERVGQPPQLGQLPLLSPGEYYGFGSRTVLTKEVVDGLKDDSITVIGLSGMAGVGKTTIVKKIADEVKNQKLFDEVALVVVSQKANMKVIQDQIASRLGLYNMENEMDDHVRRELLHKRLMDEKKKILIILDDIWEELNLNSIGIPVHGERKGFKILMTSRNARVYTDMEVQKQLQVDMLSEDEAWNLFKKTADISDDGTILPIAQEVSQECGRLPLAIFIVGKSLRKKKEYDFRNMLRKLKDPSTSNTSGVQDDLYSCIKSSYDYLESDEHRFLLLLCTLFPEDFAIRLEDLVRYSRGLSDTFKSMEEARDGVYAMVDELMGCNLLLPGEEKKWVTVHDVVRDVCISVASKSVDVNIFSKFDDLHTKLSGLKSNSLRLLRLVDEESFWKFGYRIKNIYLEEFENMEMKFYEEMQELRVLEVNQITINLPSSLQFMLNLRTLSLDFCRLKGDFAGIGSLKMLRVLSFYHSIIEIFPMEIAELTNLECLDLRFHFNVPDTLPLGTLSGLNKLEELYLGDHVLKDLERLKVGPLSKLHTIQCEVDESCMDDLLKNMNISKLTRFYIQCDSKGPIEYEIRENVLHLIEKIVDMDIHLLKILMPRVESFELNGEGLANVVDVLGEDDGSKNLRSLDLRKCEMKYLVAATNNHQPNGVFGKLESLIISDANQLEELIHGHHQLGTLQGSFQCPFGNLRRLDIDRCDKIKSLFSKSMVNCFRNLKTIKVSECPILEKMITIIEDKQVNCLEVSQFQTLRELALLNLPKFRSFGPRPGLIDQIMLPELEDLEIKLCDSIMEREGEPEQQEFCFYLGCSLPNVRRMTIKECNNLFSIAKSGLLHGFQKLEYLGVSDCSSLEVVFEFEVIMSLSTAGYEETILGRLEVLDLRELPKLKHIWRINETRPFQNLKEINVLDCGSLSYLLTPTVARMLLRLVSIWLHGNDLMESLIGRGVMGRIILPKLKNLTVEDLPRFRKLCCSPDLTLELPSLNKLKLSNSPVDIFTTETHALQNLAKVMIFECGRFKYLLTSSPQVFVHLEELELIYNRSMEAIFGYECSDGDEIPNKIIVLPKLRKLEILCLQNFRMFCCSPNINVELPSLTELLIRECPNMIKLCAGQLSTPKLTHVIYGWMKDMIDLGTFTNSWLKDRESKIRCLECSWAEKHTQLPESYTVQCELRGPKCIRPPLTRTTSANSHFNYQTKESEVIQESSNATGSGQEESW